MGRNVPAGWWAGAMPARRAPFGHGGPFADDWPGRGADGEDPFRSPGVPTYGAPATGGCSTPITVSVRR